MNIIYRVGLNGSDFQTGGLALAKSQKCLPPVNCDECGENNVVSMQWRPDWNVSPEFLNETQKTKVGMSDLDTVSIKQFNSEFVPNIIGLIPDSRVVAGTFFGYNTITVPVKGSTSELKQIHLRNKQPIITASSSHLCSSDFAEVISIDRQVHLVEVKLRVNDGEVPYFVFCDRYVPAWSQEEWNSHGMTICSSCGSIRYKKYPKTYTKKGIRKEWFENGPSIIKSREHNCLLVNESMRSLLTPISSRIEFTHYGSW